MNSSTGCSPRKSCTVTRATTATPPSKDREQGRGPKHPTQKRSTLEELLLAVALSALQCDRAHVRTPQGLSSHRNPRRPPGHWLASQSSGSIPCSRSICQQCRGKLIEQAVAQDFTRPGEEFVAVQIEEHGSVERRIQRHANHNLKSRACPVTKRIAMRLTALGGE